jgi:hypothetical protein
MLIKGINNHEDLVVNQNQMLETQKPGDARLVPSDQMYPYGDRVPGGVFSDGAHENLIKSKGFRALHFRHALDPNRNTIAEGVLSDKINLSGAIYYDCREFFVVPQGLRWEDMAIVQGLHGKHTFTANHTGYYENTCERVYLRKNDIVVFKGNDHGLVMLQQYLTVTGNGLPVRAKFPIEKADGTTRYEHGNDFTLSNGELIWTKRPATSSQQSRVLSLVYWTKPVFVVNDTPRIFRTVWSNTYAQPGIEANATYLPGMAVLSMSWLGVEEIPDNVRWPLF